MPMTKEERAALSRQLISLPMPTVIDGRVTDAASAIFGRQQMLDLLAAKVTLDQPPADEAKVKAAAADDPHDTAGKITASQRSRAKKAR